MTDDDATAPTLAEPRRSRARVIAWSITGLLVCMVVGFVMMGAIAWHLLRTESGSRRLLDHLPYVTATGTRGALWGDFDAERVVVAMPNDGGTVTLQGLGWRGLSISRGSTSDLLLRVSLAELHAASVDIALKSRPTTSPSEPMKAPTDLRLPVEVDLAKLVIGRIDMAALGTMPLRDLQARIHLGANGGALHRIDGLHLAHDTLVADGALAIGASTPFDIDARVDVSPAATAASASASAPATPPRDLRASASLTGPLAQPLLVATLNARADAAQPLQTVEARATLAPFAAWPLAALQASTRSLDLSALIAGAPTTALTGEATATSSGIDQPIVVQATLANERAGAWNDARLPVRHLAIELQLKANDPNHVTLQSIVAELGTQAAQAGRFTGRGAWSSGAWNLDAALQSVAPSKLDARAPTMVLSGPITLKGNGFGDAAANPDGGTVDVLADIAGQLADGGPIRDAKLRASASLNARRIDIRELTAVAGSARAALSGTATQADAKAPWVVKTKASLTDFDPTPWWPGDAGSAWRRGPHRLNAKADVDLSAPLPNAGATLTPWQQLAALRGRLDVTLADSQLAGVPLSADIHLRAADGRRIGASAKIDAAGNHLNADGDLSTAATGSDDHWAIDLDAPTLKALAPIWRLTGASAVDFGGSAQAKASVAGRWPAITTRGELDANALRAGAASVQHASASWQIALAADGAMNLDASLTQAGFIDPHPPAGSSGRRVIESVQASIKGTTHAHTIAIDASTGALPPAWTDALMAKLPASAVAVEPAMPPSSAVPAASAAATAFIAPIAPAAPLRSVAVLRAEGGFIDATAPRAVNATPLQFDGWRGTVRQVDVHPSIAPDAPWLRTRDVAIEARWAEAASVNVQAGRADVLSGAIRWSRIAWQAASPGQPMKIDLDAELEPLKISPLLARAQPAFGWGGDLAIAGHVRLHSAPTFTADVVIERRSGDLSVTDDLGTQPLGLTDLRIALDAHDGTWTVTQALAGSALGTTSGAIVIRTAPNAPMPADDSPISGTLELRVANLGTWGNWVPAGWRLAGALRASARIDGRFGAPEYTGQVVGTQLGVRNFLQGVNVTDGDLQVTLKGNSAHVDRFTAKAGTGSIKLDGDVGFGESPTALLKLTADHFQLLGRVDRKVVVSGQSDIRFGRDAVTVTGQLGVDEGLIDFTRSDAPSLGDDVTVVRRTSAAPSSATTATSTSTSTSTSTPSATAPAKPDDVPAIPAGTTRATNIDLRVGLGDKLHLRGRGIDTDLRGDLRVTSPGGKLSVVGTVRTSGGTYAAYRQKLTIDRGTITFSGAVDNPQLDIQATRSDTDVKVGVVVTGGAVDPRVRLYSEPDVSDMDKLSWLVLGRASDGLGKTDTALLQQAALALLAGDGPSKTDEFTKAIGLDDIAIKQSDAGTSKDTVVALGKQLSRRWYVGYERGLSATAGSFQLVYRLAQRLTVRAQSGSDNSLDVIWTLRWH